MTRPAAGHKRAVTLGMVQMGVISLRLTGRLCKDAEGDWGDEGFAREPAAFMLATGASPWKKVRQGDRGPKGRFMAGDVLSFPQAPGSC